MLQGYVGVLLDRNLPNLFAIKSYGLGISLIERATRNAFFWKQPGEVFGSHDAFLANPRVATL